MKIKIKSKEKDFDLQYVCKHCGHGEYKRDVIMNHVSIHWYGKSENNKKEKK